MRKFFGLVFSRYMLMVLLLASLVGNVMLAVMLHDTDHSRSYWVQACGEAHLEADKAILALSDEKRAAEADQRRLAKAERELQSTVEYCDRVRKERDDAQAKLQKLARVLSEPSATQTMSSR